MMRSRIHALAVALTLTAGCDGSPTGPSAEACGPETTAVTVAVTTGPSVVFDWEPACGVALLLVEEGATDQWFVATDEELWVDPDRANRVFPPVTYGQVPSGDLESREALPLAPGVSYELILWRIVPEGVECPQRLGTACLIAVQPFER